MEFIKNDGVNMYGIFNNASNLSEFAVKKSVSTDPQLACIESNT